MNAERPKKFYARDSIPPETWGMIENEEFIEFAEDYYAKLLSIAENAVVKFFQQLDPEIAKRMNEHELREFVLKVFEGFNSPIAFVYKTWKFDKQRELEAKGAIERL